MKHNPRTDKTPAWIWALTGELLYPANDTLEAIRQRQRQHPDARVRAMVPAGPSPMRAADVEAVLVALWQAGRLPMTDEDRAAQARYEARLTPGQGGGE